MRVEQALTDRKTVLGRAALAQSKRLEAMKGWTPEQREAFWAQVAKATR